MGRLLLIVVPILIALGAIIWAIIWFGRSSERREDKRAGRPVRGDLTAREEQMLIRELDKVEQLLRRINTPPSALDDDFTILGDRDRVAIERWLHTQDTRKAQNPQ